VSVTPSQRIKKDQGLRDSLVCSGEGRDSYKSPTWPKKVRVRTGTRARRNAIDVSSLCDCSVATLAQFSHAGPVHGASITGSFPFVSIGVFVFTAYLLNDR